MKKTPLQQLDQYQAGLALVTVLLLGLGMFAPWGYSLLTLQTACLVGGAITLIVLLLSWTIGYAAAAIVDAVNARDSVD